LTGTATGNFGGIAVVTVGVLASIDEASTKMVSDFKADGAFGSPIGEKYPNHNSETSSLFFLVLDNFTLLTEVLVLDDSTLLTEVLVLDDSTLLTEVLVLDTSTFLTEFVLLDNSTLLTDDLTAGVQGTPTVEFCTPGGGATALFNAATKTAWADFTDPSAGPDWFPLHLSVWQQWNAWTPAMAAEGAAPLVGICMMGNSEDSASIDFRISSQDCFLYIYSPETSAVGDARSETRHK